MSLSDEFDEAFLSTDNPFAESVVYISGGVEKTINAIVRRGGIIKNNNKADNTKALYDYEILVSLNDIPAVTVNKDEIIISTPQYGQLATNRCTVAGIVGHSPMSWKLGLRG